MTNPKDIIPGPSDYQILNKTYNKPVLFNKVLLLE